MTHPKQVLGKGRGLDSRTWVIMGGGAAKGFAHIGAWKAIQEAEIPVAGIIGSSTGAMFGAAFAGGEPSRKWRSTPDASGDATS